MRSGGLRHSASPAGSQAATTGGRLAGHWLVGPAHLNSSTKSSLVSSRISTLHPDTARAGSLDQRWMPAAAPRTRTPRRRKRIKQAGHATPAACAAAPPDGPPGPPDGCCGAGAGHGYFHGECARGVDHVCHADHRVLPRVHLALAHACGGLVVGRGLLGRGPPGGEVGAGGGRAGRPAVMIGRRGARRWV